MFFNFFFLFKQNTAYELCISDWSSDVCSSDLRYWRAAACTQQLANIVVLLGRERARANAGCIGLYDAQHGTYAPGTKARDRKSAEQGMRGAVRVETRGGRSVKKKTTNNQRHIRAQINN